MNDELKTPDAPGDDEKVQLINAQIAELTPSGRKRFFEKFLLAALGSIPWVGGFISTMATLQTEAADLRANDLRTQWLREHQQKLNHLAQTLSSISERF